MSRQLFTVMAVGCTLFVGVPATVPAADKVAETKVIRVDCNKGQSINEALAKDEPNLVIEISGVCAESVTITRDNVALRGVATGATIDGATLPSPKSPGIAVLGATNVTLENLVVQHMGRAVALYRSAGAALTNAILQDSSHGLFVAESSSAIATDCAMLRNTVDGISVWQNSAVQMDGTVRANSNGRTGIIASGGSSADLGVNAVDLEVNDNVGSGIYLQLGASSQLAGRLYPTVAINRNGVYGVAVSYGASLSGTRVECNGNRHGAVVSDASLSLGQATISNSTRHGIIADGNSFVELGNGSTVSGNGRFGLMLSGSSKLYLDGTTVQLNGARGVWLDGSAATIGNSTLTGNVGPDVAVEFGSRASFEGGNTAGTVVCDSTVLVRGDVSCPPAALVAASRSVSEHPDEHDRPRHDGKRELARSSHHWSR